MQKNLHASTLALTTQQCNLLIIRVYLLVPFLKEPVDHYLGLPLHRYCLLVPCNTCVSVQRLRHLWALIIHTQILANEYLLAYLNNLCQGCG